MDIYEPHVGERPSGVVKYLVEVEGYQESAIRRWTLRERYDSLRCAGQLKRFFRGDLHVDVVMSKSLSAIAPIFNFHCTPVFNWISAE